MCVRVNRLPEEAFGAVRANVGGAGADRADGSALRSDPCSSEGGVAVHRSGHHLPGRSLRVHHGLARATARSHQARQVSTKNSHNVTFTSWLGLTCVLKTTCTVKTFSNENFTK